MKISAGKKYRLAKVAIIIHIVLAVAIYVIMCGSDLGNYEIIKSWGLFFWAPWLVSFNAILAAFGLANAFDKKTIANLEISKQEPKNGL